MDLSCPKRTFECKACHFDIHTVANSERKLPSSSSEFEFEPQVLQTLVTTTSLLPAVLRIAGYGFRPLLKTQFFWLIAYHRAASFLS